MKQFLSTILGQSNTCPPSNKSGSMGTCSRHVGLLLLLSGFLLLYQEGYAQVWGTVFRDFNSNGTRENTTTLIEPFVAGITVEAYNTGNTEVGSTVTNSSGVYSFTGLTLPLRIEFSGYGNDDYTTVNGVGNRTSVQFYTAATTAANFGINYPSDYC